jgi:hypothetical protein
MRYEAKKGTRINYKFFGMTNFDDYWWVDTLKKWVKISEVDKRLERSTHRDCRSTRAFRRMLKTAPKGVEFILVSRWVGYNVYGKR